MVNQVFWSKLENAVNYTILTIEQRNYYGFAQLVSNA
jgi:hypothetical protein